MPELNSNLIGDHDHKAGGGGESDRIEKQIIFLTTAGIIPEPRGVVNRHTTDYIRPLSM